MAKARHGSEEYRTRDAAVQAQIDAAEARRRLGLNENAPAETKDTNDTEDPTSDPS